jgi:hypothetical protein
MESNSMRLSVGLWIFLFAFMISLIRSRRIVNRIHSVVNRLTETRFRTFRAKNQVFQWNECTTVISKSGLMVDT